MHLALWGKLPGAREADLTLAPPASIAAAPSVPSRNNGSSSSSSSSSSVCVAVLTCQDVSCSGDTLANSARQIDGALLCRDARGQCRQNVTAAHWRRACIWNARIARRRRALTSLTWNGLPCEVGWTWASPPTSPHDCCLWPADHNLNK